MGEIVSAHTGGVFAPQTITILEPTGSPERTPSPGITRACQLSPQDVKAAGRVAPVC